MSLVSISTVEKQITSLKDEIRYHERRYYIDAMPEISDTQFDILLKKLADLEKNYPHLVTPDSPTQRVGGEPAKGFSNITHRFPMLSIDNSYSYEDLKAFDERVKRLLNKTVIDYVVELKIDGLGVSLIYKNGYFITGATRGDGITGEDITANLKTIKTIPLKLKECDMTSGEIETRGEVYITRQGFEATNKERKVLEEPLFANPRNAAAGSLRLLDPKIVSERPLDIFIYSVEFINSPHLNKRHYTSLMHGREIGFKINPNISLCKGISEVAALIDRWKKDRDNLDYDTDGLVIKVDSFEEQRILGSTSKYPRWAVAYKFQPKQAVAKVLDIIIQVGRTGALTPVAILEPVLLSGSIISRTTLHNEDEIRRKDIRIGDTVMIEKGGDVIPKVSHVITSNRDGSERLFTMPLVCPDCGADIIKPEGEVVSRCSGGSCSGKIRDSILHFASRDGMDIDHLGPSIADKLLQNNLIKDIADIYTLTVKDISGLPNMGEKSAENLISSIEKSKSRGLARLIYALGIRHVGIRTAGILAERYNDIFAVANANKEEIEAIYEIGGVVAESIEAFFKDESNLEMLKRLQKYGVILERKEDEKKKGYDPFFVNKQFVLTGTLKNFSRDKAREIIQNKGGRVMSAVSKKTDYIIAGEDPGSKYDAGIKLGIAIIDETEFLSKL